MSDFVPDIVDYYMLNSPNILDNPFSVERRNILAWLIILPVMSELPSTAQIQRCGIGVRHLTDDSPVL